ncbi:MAG: aldo/keto reductase [Eubacteriales bacterium]|nr:aldo/keto reductase [Eubacteriales bacterium]
MQYRCDKNERPLSVLGYGCLRFTKKNGKIDLEKAESEIMEAIRGGVNYFDTAYVYAGSEAALGEILSRNQVRDQVYIATKLPHYLIKSKAGLEKCFQEQLRRLKTDHVDYYLMHMLNDADTWESLKKKGVDEWLREKQAAGQIGSVGFSYHGNTQNFKALLDAGQWDFCQIQYNYLDEHTQAGREGLLYAQEKGIPVVIMEPLRGGRLVQLLPEEAKRVFAEADPERTPAEWAFRWLWDQSGVTVVLSGMNSLEMVRENVRVASEARAGELTPEQRELYGQVTAQIRKKIKVGCTACGYCMPCPQGIDIPGTFRCYNELYTGSRRAGKKEYLMTTAFRKRQNPASGCVRCGKCEKHCPQQIAVRRELENAARELEDLRYRALSFLVRHLRIWQ